MNDSPHKEWDDLVRIWGWMIARIHMDWVKGMRRPHLMDDPHSKISIADSYDGIGIIFQLTASSYEVDVVYTDDSGELIGKSFRGVMEGDYSKIYFFDSIKYDIRITTYIYDLIKVRSL